MYWLIWATTIFILLGSTGNQFDWPVMWEVLNRRNCLPKTGQGIASFVFDLAQKQIESFVEKVLQHNQIWRSNSKANWLVHKVHHLIIKHVWQAWNWSNQSSHGKSKKTFLMIFINLTKEMMRLFIITNDVEATACFFLSQFHKLNSDFN